MEKRTWLLGAGLLNALLLALLGLYVVSQNATHPQLPGNDLSKAYVVQNASQPGKITLGGIFSRTDNKFYQVELEVRSDQRLHVGEAHQEVSADGGWENKLRNTAWQGEYDVYNHAYSTTLTIEIVQGGYVGGEITHEPSASSTGRLHARVAGDILNQYQVNGDFVDQDRIAPEVLAKLPKDAPTRQLIRVKRVRGFEFVNGTDDSSWSTNREYRVTLEVDKLTGVVQIPTERYGENESLSDEGKIRLQLVGGRK